MAMMMTGRVLLVCALCVLWCGLCGIAAEAGEIKDESSKGLHFVSQASEAGKKELLRSEAAAPRLGEEQEKSAQQKDGLAISSPTRQVEREKAEEGGRNHSEEGEVDEAKQKENEGALEGTTEDREKFSLPAKGQPTRSEPPPQQQLPASDANRSGGISGGGSKINERSNGSEGPNLNSSFSSSADGRPPAVVSSGSVGGTGSAPGGKGGEEGGSPGVDSSTLPVSVVALPSSTPGGGGASEPAIDASSIQNLKSSEKIERSDSTVSPGIAPLNMDTQKKSKPKEEPRTFRTQEKREQDTDVGATNKNTEESATEALRLLKVPHTASSTPAGPEEPAAQRTEGSQVQANRDDGQGLPPEATKSQTSTGQNHKTSQSSNESTSPTLSSKDEVAVQHGHVTVRSDSMTNASTNSQTETTAPSISTDDSGDAHSMEDENNDNAEGPNPTETTNHEDNKINDAPTSTEAAHQTAITLTLTQTNDTTPPGDSDSSTAVSHT
ncbi:mucin-associated surface protein (MASP), putative, partial [Trypanosoma cruzi marinkellei]